AAAGAARPAGGAGRRSHRAGTDAVHRRPRRVLRHPRSAAGLVSLPRPISGEWRFIRVNLALGADAPERQAAYRQLFATHLDPDLLRDVRACPQTGTPQATTASAPRSSRRWASGWATAPAEDRKSLPPDRGSDDDPWVIDL
ncbi:hypothetical protein RZS08_12735, partial [Arthrospira platensis SPKY1]|nr:hypothetical protein [Arthrospira platensis SPKY1]